MYAENKICCFNCKYGIEDEERKRTRIKFHSKESIEDYLENHALVVECRCNPPTAISNPPEGEGEFDEYYKFPNTDWYEWCGQFEHKGLMPEKKIWTPEQLSLYNDIGTELAGYTTEDVIVVLEHLLKEMQEEGNVK